MKRVLPAFVFFLAMATQVLAQPSNSWIQFNQQYFKIPVAKEGIYRISYADLIAAGFPAGSNPKNIQVYHRGIQQAVRVEGEGDGQFDTGDFIEFYGRPNDGSSDSELYVSPAAQPHKYYNLYSDTTCYFVTVAGISGKRITTYSSATSGSPESFHQDEKLLVLTNQYSGGIDYGNVQQTVFDIGEGWTGTQLLQNQSTTYTLTGITAQASAAGQPTLEVLLTGRGPMAHQAEIYAGARLLATVSFTGFESYTHTQSIAWSDITADGKLAVMIKVIGFSGLPDRLSAGYVKLSYPQQLNMENAAQKVFRLRENVSGESNLQIANAPAGTRLFDVTDPASVVELATTQSATLDAMAGNTESSRKILAASTVLTSSVKPVTFRSITPGSQNFVIISHPLLRRSSAGYSDPVKAYADYRASTEGGGYDTLVLNIEQLYDQFNYGEQSPLGVFHLMQFLATADLPQYLLFIGKGLQVNYGYYRNPGAYKVYKDLVPTAGYPGSDMAFTAGLSGDPYVAAVATGRISASTADDVAAYLNKIKETEARPFDDLRRKNMLHLSGGIEEHEPQQFRIFMEEFQQISESFYYGAKVTPVAKQSTDIRLVNIAEEINKGLGMVTFFGHSAPTTQDFDIGYVTNPVLGYNNAGKYPVFLMNGCDAGATFLNTLITSENWVNAANKGAVGFIAHSSYGLVFSLRNYSDIFYKLAFGDSLYLGKGVGEVQKALAKRYLDEYGVSDVNISQVQQMVLQGDPALRIFGAAKPDYEVKEGNASISSFDGDVITALTDSFKLNVVIRNFGRATTRQHRIEVLRKFNDGSTVAYDTIVNPVLYSDTVTLVIRNSSRAGFGNNTFTVTIDADDIIEELNESNNTASLQYFIPLDGTKNLFPPDFAIVNSKDVNLSFQCTDLLSDERNFILQVDTAHDFTSAYKKEFVVKGKVLARQAITLLDSDSTVYYWRTKLAEPGENESTEWDVNSFTYINNGPEGWAQVSFPQFSNNPSVGLVKDPQIRRLKFEENSISISIRNFSAVANKPRDSVSVKVNGIEYNLYHENNGATGCRLNTINLIAFDRKSTQPYAALYFKWYEIQQIYGGRRLICGREPYITNSFKANEMVTGKNDDLIQYINNVPAGDSVVMYNIGDADYANWPAAARSKLGEIGISLTQLSDLQTGEAVVIFGKKGAVPGTAQFFRTSPTQPVPHKLVVNKTITGRYSSGNMNSSTIGPAQHWEDFIIQYNEAEVQDLYEFKITGIRLNGSQQLLRTGVTASENISDIDAGEYPYLKVEFQTTDDVLLTPVQLKKWLVTYEPFAEGIILYDGEREQETVTEGDVWSARYSFVNISNRTFNGPLTVNYKAMNVSTFATADSTLVIEAPIPGDTTHFDVALNTNGQAGINDVEVFVNRYHQPEQYYDNNVVNLVNHLNVIGDRFSPVLDVTVDGRHLATNDFVSPNPAIQVRMWDENRYLFKKDTTGLTILLAYPCDTDDCAFETISFLRDDIEWIAATDTSDFIVNFNPVNLVPGKYTLRVAAKDVSGNTSGVDPYEISFLVSAENGLTISTPFPNPFEYKTNFTILVSGSDVPDNFNMRIVSLTGDVVNTFDETDLPAFHVGANTIRWSGTDSDGNSLPNGVYVYQMVITAGGKKYEVRGKVILAR